MIKKIAQFLKSEDGATAVEYAIMVALIAAVIIGTVTILGNNTNDKFDQVGMAFDNADTDSGRTPPN
jgi:pilus assembly protein Flp/PilA